MDQHKRARLNAIQDNITDAAVARVGIQKLINDIGSGAPPAGATPANKQGGLRELAARVR